MGGNGKSSLVRDSKGRHHYIMYQTYGTTCGPVCAAMLEYYYKNLSCRKDAEEVVKDLTGWKEGGVGRGDLAEKITKNLNIPCELIVVNPKKSFFETLKNYVTPRTPAIVDLDHSWQYSGHYALCRSIDSDGIGIFLDPVTGLHEVKNTKLPFFRFNIQGKFYFAGGIIVSRMSK
jgi:hypothetical protein